MTSKISNREKTRQAIIKQISQHGGYSVFWITNDSITASVASEMIEAGELVVRIDRDRHQFPWMVVELREARR